MLAAASRGLSVVGLEQFGAAHNAGSSHGQSRIIREAYYEHPDYVPMARRSVQRWQEIEARTGVRLMHRCGLLQVGRPDSEVIQGVETSADRYGIEVEHLAPAALEQRWPWWRVPADCVGLFEPGAGFLRVEACVAAMIRMAIDLGAVFRPDAAVTSLSVRDDGNVELVAGSHRWIARRAVVSCGPWSGRVLARFPGSVNAIPELTVLRKQQQWFQVDTAAVHYLNGGVCWLVDEGPESCFYGLPAIDRLGIKVAEHSGGQICADPDRLDRQIAPGDVERAGDFMDRWFRFGRRHLSFASVCMYTLSPDRHFLIDRFPGLPQIALAAGLSGHGFKFAPVLGEALVSLAMGEEPADCGFLGLQRFADASSGS